MGLDLGGHALGKESVPGTGARGAGGPLGPLAEHAASSWAGARRGRGGQGPTSLTPRCCSSFCC